MGQIMSKYKLTWKDLTTTDFKTYLFAMFKAFIPKKKIKNLDELETFIQTKSAWVTQVTLYNYLKTRMGTRYVLHFENDKFMGSVNLAKWNIYSVALQDLSLFTFSYLRVNFNFQDTDKAKEIFNKILDDEISNKMPLEIVEQARIDFENRFQNINWNIYYTDLPFNPSALSLYKWAPIAEELKTLDRKIVLNSMILKWDVIKQEFQDLVQFYIFFLLSTVLSTTLGSAKVVVSPNCPCSFAAFFFFILLIILPDLVFGRPGVKCIKSGVARGPICFLTQSVKSLSRCPFSVSPALKVT